METAKPVRRCRLQRQSSERSRDGEELSRAHQTTQRRERRQKAQAGVQSQKMGRGANPLMAEPISKTAGQLRENRTELRCTAVLSRSDDLLEADGHYSRISSKPSTIEAMFLGTNV